MGNQDYNYSYRQPSNYGSQQACGPCQPKFEDMGYVAFTPPIGTRGFEDQLGNAITFWQSLADPSLGGCVNELGLHGRPFMVNYPGACGSDQQGYYSMPYGGGHGGGEHGGGGSGHANVQQFGNAPYTQPFAQSSYQGASQGGVYPNGYQQPQAGANNAHVETAEEMQWRLGQELKKQKILEEYQQELANRANKGHTADHNTGAGSIGNAKHGANNAQLPDAAFLQEQMKSSEFQAYLRSIMAERSSLLYEGRMTVADIKQAAQKYFTENAHLLEGRHISDSAAQAAAYGMVEANKDNKFNWDGTKVGTVAVASIFGKIATACGFAGAVNMEDGYELSKGDMSNFH